ncbi:MAG: hypothetical protein NC218_08345 [Acetobacter sp.]|nr:hypothetical protein [Acetobacter sp.]
MSSNLNPNTLSFPVNYNGAESIDDLFQQLQSAPRRTFEYVPPQAVTQIPTQSGDERYNQIMAARATEPAPISEMQIRDGNILRNFGREMREVGTGLTHLWANKGDLLFEGLNNLSSFYEGHTPTENILRTIRQGLKAPEALVNLTLAPYNFNTADIGERSLRDILGGAVQGAVHNPLSTTVDTLSLGLGGKVVQGLKNIPVLGRLAKAGDIEKAIAAEGVNVAADINKIEGRLNNINIKLNKLGDKKGILLQEAIEAAETGGKVSNEAKAVFKELREFSTEYDSLIKKYSPETYKGLEETAIVQKIVRDRAKINPGVTYEQVRREVVPILESGENINTLAREGNIIAKEVAGAKALYDKGRIFPITHGLANVEKTTATAAEGLNGLAAAERAGQFSNRLWGSSSYEDIAKQLQKPDAILEDISKRYMDKQMASAILRGELGGLDLTLGKDQVSNIRYIDRGLLEQGKVSEALDNIRRERLLNTDIAMDADIASELSKQLGKSNTPYAGIVKDLYQTGKSAMLAQGTYLGANALTGATNAIINSGTGVISDFIEALKSEGRLSKQANIYRRSVKPSFSQTPGLNQIQKFNYYTGGKLLSKADGAMQNLFAEMAAHADLRKAGVASADRLNALENMDKIKLGQMIIDMRRAALINSTNTGILPKWATDVAGVINPFYRWNITATQSTARMLEKNPLLANTVLLDIMANIGFDREMQNRLNLGVSLDKPYVSFKMDKDGNMRQMSAEFVPITTTLKTFDFAQGGLSGSTTIPIMGTLFNAAQGLDKYGKPMKRAVSSDGIITQTVGTRRMQYNPATGEFKTIGGQGDEILSAIVTNLLGAPNLYNRTIGPLLSPIFGEDGQFYQPYNQSLLGSFSRGENANNAIVGGNALRGRSAQDVINILSGIYDNPYFESSEQITPSQQRRFMRDYNRDIQRKVFGD